MFDEKHEERKKFIKKYFNDRQYLKKDVQFVFSELENLYKELDKNGLLPEKMSYQQFVSSVYNAFMLSQLSL